MNDLIERNKKMIEHNKQMIRQNNVFLAIIIPFLILQGVCILMAFFGK